MKIKYIDKNFANSSLTIIDQANSIIEEYLEQGFKLTLRQLYYQFVSRDLIPNKQSEYKRLGSIINDGRLAGLIDWDSIEDRTRNLQKLPHWSSPAEIVDLCINQYRIDKWNNQEYRPEVWIEKDALLGIIENICNQHEVPFFSCRGFTSQSEMWSAGRRFGKCDQTPIIIHLGDHDPSGIDMTRDVNDRLELFMGGMRVNRIALNMDQIELYDPPPNFAKVTDSRSPTYIKNFGEESWELDALEPSVLVNLIDQTITSLKDPDLWQEKIEEEQEHIDRLKKIRI